MLVDRSATRLAASLSLPESTSPTTARDLLAVDLTARSSALALAGARRAVRSLLYARDAVDEWTIAAELRPPTVRAFEAAATALLAATSEALNDGWQSSCAACGQAVRVAAWRWEDPLDADREGIQPTGRRATCAACRALGRRGGEASAVPPNEVAATRTLEPALRARIDSRFTGAVDGAASRWSTRQLRALDAMSTALERSSESAVMLGALRLTLTEAAAAMARPQRTGRTWWEIAPWQAMLDAIDARRRTYLTAQSVPPHLTMSSDLSSLTYPGGGAVLVRGGVAARSSLATLLSRTPTIRGVLVRVTVGGSAEELTDRAIAGRWAGAQSEPDPLLGALQSNSAVTIASALARLFVALNPLMAHDPLVVIELDDHVEQLAGVLTAISLAGAAGNVSRRCDDDQTHGLTVTVRLSDPALQGERPRNLIGQVSDLVVAHGEPVTPRQLLPAFASARARAAHAAGEVLDAVALTNELLDVANLHGTLRPAGSFDQLIAMGEGRIFVEGRAERERLAVPAADRADAAAWALVGALEIGAGADEALLVLDGESIGIESELRSVMLDAYTSVADGVRRARRSVSEMHEERVALIAGLLELGPRMGLHVAVAPALASTIVAGRTLGARTTVDPIDSSPPLRLRSDRGAYDAVDAVLYRRGRVVLLCEVVTGPLPIGNLLLERHAAIASDREVVRLLVLAPALVPLLQLRLARDERMSAAWEDGNWHLLAADRVAALARMAAPRLADLEGHLGAEPPARDVAQLDLSSMGWGVTETSEREGVDDEPRT
ncbi:MAG: hypothetical protein ACO25N_00645 [Candidatus Limnocylindrus sp.]